MFINRKAGGIDEKKTVKILIWKQFHNYVLWLNLVWKLLFDNNANLAELYNYELFNVKRYQPNYIFLYTGAHG